MRIGEPVPLEPQPRHLAPALHEVLTDGRDVVFGIARRHARRAPRAFRQVDRETPARLLAAIVAELSLLILSLGPPLDGLFRVFGCLFVVEWRLARAQRPGARDAQHLDR